MGQTPKYAHPQIHLQGYLELGLQVKPLLQEPEVRERWYCCLGVISDLGEDQQSWWRRMYH